MPQRTEPGEHEFDPDERVSIPLDFETALRALLKVDPKSEPVDEDEEIPRT